MPVDVICPKCHSKLRAPDEVAGRNVRCKKCQEKFKVPSVGVTVDPVGETEQLSVHAIQLPQVAQVKVAVVAGNDNTPLPPMRGEANPNDPFGFTSDPPKSKLKEQSKAKNPPPIPKPDVDQLVGGEPTFAMPGASEDAAPGHGAGPLHAAQFSFEDSTPFSAPVEEVEEEAAPKSVPVKKRSYRAEKQSPARGTKAPAKSRKMLYIFGGIATGLLIGCGGVAAGVFFFAKSTTEAVAKATVTVGPGAIVPPKEEPKPASNAQQSKKGAKESPASTIPFSGFTLPTESAGPVTLEQAGGHFPLAFDMGAARQIHYFNHSLVPMVFAVFRTQLGFNGRGSEDTITLHSPDSKVKVAFTVPADGIAGPRLFDISDYGMRLAIEAPAGRLTVFDLETKNKLLDGVDVYAGLPEREGIAALAFGDANGETVAVIDRTGAVDVWKGKNRIVTGTVGSKPSPVAVQVRECEEPGGMMAGKDGLRFVTWETGVMTAAVALPPKSGLPTLVTSKRINDGKTRVAFAHKPEGGQGHEVWLVEHSPASGPTAPLWRIALPAEAGVPTSLRLPELYTDDLLVIGFDTNGSLLLCDCKTKTVVAYFKVEAGKTLVDASGRAWLMAAPDSKGKATMVLAGQTFNRDTIASRVKYFVQEAQASKKPILLVPTPEGLGKK